MTMWYLVQDRQYTLLNTSSCTHVVGDDHYLQVNLCQIEKEQEKKLRKNAHDTKTHDITIHPST